MSAKGGVLRGGMTAAELAKMTGKSRRHIVRKFGEPREEYLRRAAETRQKVLELREEGKTIRSIAAELGVSVGTVHRHIKSAD